MLFLHGHFGDMSKGDVNHERQHSHCGIFIVGVMCGFGNFIPHFVSGNSDISFYALCALMFLSE